jgi:hypothetical protein
VSKEFALAIMEWYRTEYMVDGTHRLPSENDSKATGGPGCFASAKTFQDGRRFRKNV